MTFLNGICWHAPQALLEIPAIGKERRAPSKGNKFFLGGVHSTDRNSAV